ncbi:MAG: SHOCT domain-containing protein [Candidatus Ranarchaeia archaeon]
MDDFKILGMATFTLSIIFVLGFGITSLMGFYMPCHMFGTEAPFEYGYIGWWLMPLGGILVVSFLAIGLYILYSMLTKGHNQELLNVLKERYARGEISFEEYEKMRDRITW